MLLRGLLWTLGAAALLCGVSGVARAEDYPSEVNAAIADASKYCEDTGGKFSIALSAMHKVDLNGDKRDDYVVDFTDAACDGADGGLCGTGGCEISIMVALPSGKFVTVFDAPVLSWEVLSRDAFNSISIARRLLRRARWRLALHEDPPHYDKAVRIQDALARDDEVGVFGVLLDIGIKEIAAKLSLQATGADRIERAPGELRADAAAAERLRHFGVNQNNPVRLQSIVDEGHVAVDVEFVTALCGVVANFVGHGDSLNCSR